MVIIYLVELHGYPPLHNPRLLSLHPASQELLPPPLGPLHGREQEDVEDDKRHARYEMDKDNTEPESQHGTESQHGLLQYVWFGCYIRLV